HLQIVPEELIVLVQVQARASALLDLAGRQKMVQMRVGMDDADHLQPQGLQARHDQLRIAARVDQHRLASQWITDDRAVALQGADGEGFADDIRGAHAGLQTRQPEAILSATCPCWPPGFGSASRLWRPAY